ncbi:MAG TPA: hypothetical protein VGY54_05840, partial [Polyangiaceae bacterium]|nr:hypothetical protein [Polyangiaceae bacterium]
MTTRESVAAPHLGRASWPASHPSLKRFGRWVAGKGWVHLLLLIGLAGCLYPLIWMFMTSVKTDEELAQDEVLPAVPVFRDHSPYVRDDAKILTPGDLEATRVQAIMPTLRQLTTSMALSALPKEIPPSVDANRWASSAAAALISRTLAQMSKQIWDEPPDVVVERYRSVLTPEAVGAAVSDQLSRVEASALTLQVLDGRLFKLASGNDFANWQIESGVASLVALGEAVRLDYQFQSGADAPIVLVHDFELPEGVEPSDIHKLVLSIRADASWHGIDA